MASLASPTVEGLIALFFSFCCMSLSTAAQSATSLSISEISDVSLFKKAAFEISYCRSAMFAERFGSYSCAITLAGTSSLLRLKSINLYLRFAPLPWCRVVMRPSAFLPPVPFFGFVRESEPAEARVKITGEENENLRITGYEAETGYPFDTCEIRETRQGEEYEIVLRLKDPREPGKIEDTLRI